jgi:hypothetical protein
VFKPATTEFFNIDLQKKSGFRSHCIECRKKHYQDNPEKGRQRSKRYRENNHEEYLQKQKEYYWANPEKARKRSAKWAKDNPKRIAQLSIKWAEDNPEKKRESRRKNYRKRKASKLQNGHSPYTEAEVINLYGTDCHLCGQPIDFEAPRRAGLSGWEFGLQIDHVLPVTKGGPDTLENVKPAHGKCNISKSNKILN